jgi:hypothetical protein
VLESLFPFLEPSQRALAVPIAAGALTGIVIFLVALRGRRRRKAPLPPLPDDDDVRDATAPELADRRQALRRAGSFVAVRIVQPTGPGLPDAGWVTDRSARGLCVAVVQPIAVGTQLSLVPVDAPPGTAPVAAVVKHCRQKRKHYYLGCQFVSELPWSVLLLFG